MKNALRILLLGIAIGASIAAMLGNAERRRLQVALAAAEKTASERAILPSDLEERLARGRRLDQQDDWEREALGLPPFKSSTYEDGDDE